jgi:hypothetical protein
VTIAFTSTGGLYTRLGEFGQEYLRVVTTYGSALDTQVEAIRDQFETGAQASVIDNIYTNRNAYKQVHSGWLGTLQSYMQNVTIEQVNDDTPLLSKTLSNAVLELIRQMKVNSESVSAPTVSQSVAYWGSNIGDAQFVCSLTNQFGDQLNCVFPEDIKFTCTADAASGATQFREVFTITGEPPLAITNQNWPGGSGASGSITLTDADQTGLIANGGLELWAIPTAMAPNWTVVTGTAGTNITRTTSSKRGNYAIRLNSDGSTLLAFKQQLNTALIRPNRVYHFGCWAKIDTLDASGIVRFRLADGNGTTIANDATTSQTYTRNTNGQIGTSYTFISTSFQTPRQLPSSGVFLEIGFTTSPANTRTVDFDLISIVEASQLYAQGPFITAYSAATPNAVGDFATATIANNAPNASWNRAMQRWLGLTSLGSQFYLPTSGSPTIADALLT